MAAKRAEGAGEKIFPRSFTQFLRFDSTVKDAHQRYKASTGNSQRPTLAMSLKYEAEQQVAIVAVRRACALTASVFNKLVKNETLTKDDSSPVTGEYGAYSHSYRV